MKSSWDLWNPIVKNFNNMGRSHALSPALQAWQKTGRPSVEVRFVVISGPQQQIHDVYGTTPNCNMQWSPAPWWHIELMCVYIYIYPLGLFGFGQIYFKLCKNQRWTWAWSRVSSLRLPCFGETWGPLLKEVHLVHHSSSSHDHHHALVGATAAKNVWRRSFYTTNNLGELWFTNQICSPLQDFLLILRHLLLPLTAPRCTEPPFPPLACHADLFDPFAPWPITVSYMETCW